MKMILKVVAVGGLAVGILAVGLFIGHRYPQLLDRKPDAVSIGRTFRVWVSEVEVADHHANGRPWDADGSAPDLSATLNWRNVSILRTEVAQDSLLAIWEVPADHGSPSGGTAGTPSRIGFRGGLIKPEAGDRLAVHFYDQDAFDEELVGGAEWLVTDMREGQNLFTAQGDGSEIRSFLITVQPTEGGASLLPALKAREHISPFPGVVALIPPEDGDTAEAHMQNLANDWDQFVQDACRIVDEGVRQFSNALMRVIDQHMDAR